MTCERRWPSWGPRWRFYVAEPSSEHPQGLADGGFKGLLSDPGLPALNLSEASTVVFLSPMLTDTQFVQAAGRVVRQGSYHARVRVIVLAAAQSTETEDATRVDRFRQLSQPGARD